MLISSPVVYTNVLASADAIYAVGLVKTGVAYTLHVTTLTASSGSVIASVNIPANLPHGRRDFILLAPPANTPTGDIPLGPCLAWLEDATLRAAVLSSALKGQVHMIPGINYTRILDVGLSNAGQFVVFQQVGNAHVMRFDGASLLAIWEFVGVVGIHVPLSPPTSHNLTGSSKSSGRVTFYRKL